MKKILIVDDDDDFNQSLKDLLEIEGYEIFCAVDGEQGLTMLKQKKPDLVITDMLMPKCSGTSFICQFTQSSQYKATKIIAISGGDQIAGTEYLKAAETLGVNNIFEKPLDLDRLLACIKQLFSE